MKKKRKMSSDRIHNIHNYNLEREKSEAKKIARDLYYPKQILKEIEKCENVTQVSNVLCKYRKMEV